jgi:DNA-binding transcriptional ArsR family regulator
LQPQPEAAFVPLSAELAAFIRENIVSVEQIAVLLLLSEDEHRTWSVDEIQSTLTSSSRSIRERISVLRRRGLIRADDDGRFRYRSERGRDELVRALREEYARRPVSIIELIFKGRDEALESFSDAFRFGRDDERS